MDAQVLLASSDPSASALANTLPSAVEILPLDDDSDKVQSVHGTP